MNTQGSPSQCGQAVAQLGNRMAWREWKVPCFSGVVGIREKRLHCTNDPEHEEWRKGRAYARPQGRKSLGAQERIPRGWERAGGCR